MGDGFVNVSEALGCVDSSGDRIGFHQHAITLCG